MRAPAARERKRGRERGGGGGGGKKKKKKSERERARPRARLFSAARFARSLASKGGRDQEKKKGRRNNDKKGRRFPLPSPLFFVHPSRRTTRKSNSSQLTTGGCSVEMARTRCRRANERPPLLLLDGEATSAIFLAEEGAAAAAAGLAGDEARPRAPTSAGLAAVTSRSMGEKELEGKRGRERKKGRWKFEIVGGDEFCKQNKIFSLFFFFSPPTPGRLPQLLRHFHRLGLVRALLRVRCP